MGRKDMEQVKQRGVGKMAGLRCRRAVGLG